MNSEPIYGLSQRTSLGPGILGFAVSNAPVPVQLLRVTPTVRRVASRNPVLVEVYAQIQNLVGLPVKVRTSVAAVSPSGIVVRADSQTVLLPGNMAVEIPASLRLGPLGDWNVVVQVMYSFDGASWGASPDTGGTDIVVFTGDIVGQEYACSQTVCSTNHAQIDYRDNPSFASWPH